MVPGITPVIGSSKPTLAFRASSTSAASTITLPASVVAGDLIIIIDRATAFGVPAQVVPSGYTLIRSDAVDVTVGVRVTTSYKIAVGGDASAVVTGQTEGPHKIALVFSASRPLTDVTVPFSGGQATDGNPTAINVTASAGPAPLVVIGTYSNNSVTVDPRTMTPAKDAEVSSVTTFYAAYKIYNSSPADVSVDMDDEGDPNALSGFYLSVS